jgi:hypothetical protein
MEASWSLAALKLCCACVIPRVPNAISFPPTEDCVMRRIDTIGVIRHRLQGSGNRRERIGCAGPNAETRFVENPLVAVEDKQREREDVGGRCTCSFPRPLWAGVGGGVSRREARMTSASLFGALAARRPRPLAPAHKGRGTAECQAGSRVLASSRTTSVRVPESMS